MTVDDPIRSLAAAVLLRAVFDATRARVRRVAFNPSSDVTPLERDEAVKLLTAEHGEWARSRRFWCDLADRDPDEMREYALAEMRRSGAHGLAPLKGCVPPENCAAGAKVPAAALSAKAP